MKKAYLYRRVSSEEQAVEGKSIETQERICRKWAEDNGYQVVEVFTDEGKSATSLNRPALKDLLARCQEEGVNAVLVQDTDRIARNTLDHLTIKSILQKAGIQLISVSQPMIDDSPEGNLIDTIIASVNAFQSQITGRKTSKVLEEKAKIGWFPGGTPSLGYKNTDNPNPSSSLDRRIIGIDQDIAPFIKHTFEWYALGSCTIQQIADYLNNKGVKSPFGSKIHPSLVARILKDDFYIGSFSWKGVVYPGKHELFISEALYMKVQQVMKAHNQNATRQRRHNFLLRGFVFCADCERRLWGELHTKPNGKVYSFYFCSNCKKETYVDRDKLEQKVAKLFKKIQITPEYRKMVLEKAKEILKESRDNQMSEKERLLREKSKIEKAMQNAEDSRFLRQSISDEGFLRLYIRYEAQLQNINQELEGVDKDHGERLVVLERILQLAENIGGAYEQANFTLKRNYLALFFKDFKVKNGRITRFNLSDDLKPLIKNGSVLVTPIGLLR